MKILTILLVSLFFVNSMAATKPEKLIKLNFAYPAQGTVISAQIGLILEKTDILKIYGFDATVKGMGTGKELKIAMVSDQADVILTSESNFVVLRGSKYEAYAISTLGSAGRLALVVKNNGKINKLEDLKGKKIGALFGTTVHQRALEWKNKIDSKGIELINLGSIGALSSALEADSIDAVMMWDPYLEDAVRSKKVKILGTSEFDLINVMSKSFADKNPKAIEKINAALVDAFYYFINHKDEVNKWYSAISQISPETLDAASKVNKNYNAKRLSDIDIKITPQSKTNLQNVSEFLFNEKVIPIKPELNAYIK
jgi:ABC-type nitrate/sulfonate/bicarbonate transport system substrate-binding protein